MKTIIVVAAGLLAGLTAGAQGSFVFGNAASAVGGTGAPVGFLGFHWWTGPAAGGAVDRVAGNQWLAQAVVAGVPLAGTVQPFRTGGAAGFLVNQNVIVPGIPGGTSVSIQLAAWWAGWGADYATALANSGGLGGVGLSAPVNVTLQEPPNAPLGLVGLQGFTIPWIIPEPGFASLGALGAVVLFLRGKR